MSSIDALQGSTIISGRARHTLLVYVFLVVFTCFVILYTRNMSPWVSHGSQVSMWTKIGWTVRVNEIDCCLVKVQEHLDNGLKSHAESSLITDQWKSNPQSLDLNISESTSLLNRYTRLTVQVKCSLDGALLPLPILHPVENSYEVPFEVLYLSFIIIGHDCKEYGVEFDRDALSNENFSVGIGTNFIQLPVTLMTSSNSDHVTQFVHLTITRRNRSIPQAFFISGTKGFHVCKLIQNCNFRLNSNDKCGLSNAFSKWKPFIEEYNQLPRCNFKKLQALQGSWFLPCQNCGNETSCVWSQGIWKNSENCKIIQPSQRDIKNNLRNKTLLFFGDSTLRGLFYSLLNRLNGSLSSWSRCHSSLGHTNIPNTFNTSLGFVYYPRFWTLPTRKVGVHNELNDMLERMKPSNTSSIVIIIGGAQWITSKHLYDVTHFIHTRPELNVKVIVKDISAGFFLPISGVTYKPINRHIQQAHTFRPRLLKIVHQLGFHILPAHSVTWSRLDEFRPGRCLCHYHSVKQSDAISMSPTDSNESTKHKLSNYKIEGCIHDVYKTILENMLTFI